MKKSGNPLDDLFRESLEDHPVKPSEEGRAAFLRDAGELMKPPPFLKRGSARLLLLLLLLVLTGTGTGIYIFSLKENPATEQKNQAAQITENKISSPSVSQATPQENKTITPSSEIKKTPELTIHKNNSSTHVKNFTSTTPETNYPESNISKTEAIPENKTEVKPVSVEPVPAAEDKPAEKENTGNTETDASIATQPQPSPPSKPAEKSHHWNKPWYFSAGIQYTPEWMFDLAESDAKFVNNFGLEASFTFQRYSIRTGIGLSLTKGSNEIAIGTEDYLGTYNQLQSITFVWDPNNYKYVPTIKTSPKDVYDTAVTYTFTSVEKQYTYLQVPLILGYDFIMTKNIRFGVRTGPILSLLLNTKQLTTAFDPGKDKVIQINNITPERIQANWQIIAGLSLQYLPSQRFTLEIEPEARYYFNSVYEKSDVTKKPWSAAIRAAVYVNFGK